MGEVKLYGFNYSPVSKRVEIALKMKGIDYEIIEEDLKNKSDELLKYNPIHKKIPVLVHNGVPIAESLVILEYIDETWKGGYPLLPTDPYERAQVRFWANFLDEKLALALLNVVKNQEEDVKAREGANELLKFLENGINDNKCFASNGTEIGYLELVGLLITYWVPIVQEISGMELLTKDKYPAIWAWADHLLSCKVIKDSLPSKEELSVNIRAHLAALRASNAAQ